MPLRSKIILILSVVIFEACVEHSKDAITTSRINLNTTEAVNYLEAQAEDAPENPNVFFRLAKLYFNEADYEQALQNVQTALKLQPKNAEFHYLKGRVYQELNKPELALRSLLTAEGFGKKSQELYKFVAKAYLKTGEPVKAREAVERLTDVNGSAEAFAVKGKVMLSLGDTVVAVANFNNALTIDSAYYKPYEHLADLYLSRKQPEKALAYIDKLVALQPANLDFLKRKGALLQQIGQLQEAKQVFRNIASQREHYMDFYRLSDVYYQLRQYDSAEYFADQAFQKNKQFLNAKLIIARSLDKTRRYQEAIAVYESIVKADSSFNLAVTELDNLRRKVAYLWRSRMERQAAQDSARNEGPKAVEKKSNDDN